MTLIKRLTPLLLTRPRKVSRKEIFLNAPQRGLLTCGNTITVVSTNPPIVSELISEIIKKSNLFINENFTLTSKQNIFKIEQLIRNKSENGLLTTQFNQMKSFKQMKLSNEAKRIQNTPNAGGSSIESETLSFEILNKIFNAKLLKTEMEVAYFPEGGSITDYVVSMFNTHVGVSVTRAMKYYENQVFTIEDAHSLLRKKLKGIRNSSINSMIKWEKQILHVWIYDERIARTLTDAWFEIEDELKTNTVVLITIGKDSRELFVNNEKKVKLVKAKKQRIC